jgi:hypothetical protein
VEAIIAPHEGKNKFAGRVFTFTTKDGEEKTYELPDDVTFEAGYSYSFTFTLEASTTPQEPTLVSDGMTNCYIVAPNKTLKFPVSRAYTYESKAFTTKLHTGDTYEGTFTAAVGWADAAVVKSATVSGTGNSAIVKVTTNASVSGNAVVKICRSDNGETAWSYHIWVTDYDPAKNTYTNTMNTNNKSSSDGYFVFMDRNLGATEAGLTAAARGLFYQWGRKDPFPATLAPGATQPGGGSFTIVATSASLGTIENTIQNPGVFYTAGFSSGYDWLYTSRNNTLWGHASDGGTKTIYDPCPSGWRVPVNYNMSEATDPWYGFETTNGGTFANGYNWGTNAVYPAAGDRYASSGSLYYVGTSGYYWSASPNSSTGSSASLLYFYSGTVYVSNNAYRANGLSVRCSQE